MLETYWEKEILVVKVTLEKLDMAVAADFQYSFADLIKGVDSMVLLDLSNVKFMDSSGLAAFVFCFQSTDIKQELAICEVQERVAQLFRLTRMDQIVTIYPTVPEAVETLGA